ncbi:MAG TPA: hypothetical protein VGK74_12845 [Symbiobacteriaceae bacterium]
MRRRRAGEWLTVFWVLLPLAGLDITSRSPSMPWKMSCTISGC